MMDKLNVLDRYREQYQKINATMQEPQKSVRLGELMSSMEMTFKIPMLSINDYAKDNPDIIALYQEISNSRDI